MQPTPVIQEALVEAINKIVHDIRRAGEHFTVFLLHHDIGTSFNQPQGHGILPSPDQLVFPTAST
jgi:hypothetical protein